MKHSRDMSASESLFPKQDETMPTHALSAMEIGFSSQVAASRCEEVSTQLAHLANLLRQTRNELGSAASGASGSSLVERFIRGRRLRDEFFDVRLFADPAWDILLDLYLAQLEYRRATVSTVCAAAGVPATTALRYIASLAERGLLVRKPNQFDQRMVFLELTEAASESMQRYFERYSALLSAPAR